MKENAVYLQSGGPTSVINASLFGVINQVEISDTIGDLFLSHYGIKGLINNDLKNAKSIPTEQIELLPYTPSCILGSVRYKMKDFHEDEEDYLRILDTLKKNNIHYIFLNGGNDSMDTAMKLSAYLKFIKYPCKFIGIPKTIDNDLVITDHTPGFASAAKFVANVMETLTYDNLTYQKGRVNIVEIMGRDTGWLTAASGLASLHKSGPDLIFVPEVAFDTSKFLTEVERIYKEKGRVLVAVSEGIKDKEGEFVYKQASQDVFAHSQLGGVSHYLAALVEEKLNISTRAIELSLLQRCFAPEASLTDIKEAIHCGENAVKYASNDYGNGMVTMKRLDKNNYQLTYELVPFEKIANQIKYLPLSMLNGTKDNISQEFIDYLVPLIRGKINHDEKNGLYLYSQKEFF